MPTELAMHAYILLGNALHSLVNGVRVVDAERLGTTREELAALYASVEPLTPATILDGVGRLPVEKRELLVRVCRWCMEHLDDAEFGAALGVPKESADEVVRAIAGAD